MKKSFHHVFLTCLLLFASIVAMAQVTVSNFRLTFPNQLVIPGPGVGNNGLMYVTFEATVTKPVGTVLAGRSTFSVYTVDAPTLTPAAANNITAPITLPTTWTSNGTGRESGVLNGYFYINYASTSNGTKTKLEILHQGPFNDVSYSNTIDIIIQEICSGTSAAGYGNNICKSQNVPYTTQPALLSGQQKRLTAMVYRWQYNYNYPGNEWDWHDINGAESKDFQPWDCWQAVHYRRVILYENTNIWGQKYHEFESNSNVVAVLPYTPITSGVYKLRNRRSNQVLEIGGTSSETITAGTRARQWPDVGTANQEWNVTATTNGMYKIVNRNSGLALEIGGGNEPQAAGAYANHWYYWGGLKQQWVFKAIYGQSYFHIQSANTGQVLEIGGGNPTYTQAGALANQWPYQSDNDIENQWELIPVTVPTSSQFPGVYTIQNVNSTQFLEMSDASVTTGAAVTQRPTTGTANQQWTLVETDPGFYKIVNRNSSQVLEIGGFSTAAGGTAQQWPYVGGLNQQWSVDQVAAGIYKLVNRNSNQALEIGGFSTSVGATANQWPYVNGPNQQWILTFVSLNRGTVMSAAKTAGFVPKLSLYPNPTSGNLQLSLSGAAKITSVEISDLRGVLISKVHYQGGSQVDVSSLAAGAYLIHVTAEGQVYHQKFIKQ